MAQRSEITNYQFPILDLCAGLHEPHRGDNPRGQFELLQVFAGKVCARSRSVQAFARDLHYADHLSPGFYYGNRHDLLYRHLFQVSISFIGAQFDRLKQAGVFHAHEGVGQK